MNNNDLNYNQQNSFNMPNQIPNNNTNLNYSNNDNNTGNKNNKIIFIIVGVIAAVVILLLLFNCSNKNKKNTTGSSEYNSSDVDFSCTSVSDNGNLTSTTYSDFLFNYKSTGTSGTQYTYQLKQYNKMILEFKNTLTDEKYKEFIDDLNPLDCLDSGSCTGSHLELSLSKYGYDTVVDRSGNKIEITYYNLYGMGSTATKDDIKSLKDTYESKGYNCN